MSKRRRSTQTAAQVDRALAEAVSEALQLTMMTVDWWPVSKVKRYARNPRRNEQAVMDVAASLKEFGWRQPLVVDKRGVIIVGDTRYLAALQLRQTHVPVHIAATLTPAQARAYRMADNKTGERAEWDFERLAEEFAALKAAGVDLLTTGFRQFEIDPIMAAEWTPGAPTGKLGGERESERGAVLRFTDDAERAVVAACIELVREREGDETMAETACVALVCADYTKRAARRRATAAG